MQNTLQPTASQGPENEMKGRITPKAQLVFPPDLGQHFIAFKFLKYQHTEPTKPQQILEQASLILPIPQQLEEQYALSYRNLDLGIVGGRVRAIASSIGEQGFVNTVKGAVSSFTENAAADTLALAENVGDLLESGAALPGTIGDAVSIASGKTINPNAALKFEDVQSRKWSFTWKLIPQTSAESDIIRKIIQAFRFHSAPLEDGMVLEYPSEVHIQLGGSGANLMFFKRCMIEGYAVNYAPDNVPAFFRETGAPSSVQLTVNFQETTTVYRDDLTFFDQEFSPGVNVADPSTIG